MGDSLLHIAIILDGNRRFAKKKGLPAWRGHQFGARKFQELLRWCQSLPIRELTLYVFSVENFKRSEIEKKILFEMFRKTLIGFEKNRRNLEKKFEPFNVFFRGRLAMFPREIVSSMHRIMKGNQEGRKILNLCMGYGGKQEIVDAVKQLIMKKTSVRQIDEAALSRNLYLPDEPDLIIRPGGEKRVSNFLIWQGSYSEWYFTKKLWPEFTKQDLQAAILEFKKRERRFGT